MRYTFLIENMSFSYSRLTAFEQCRYGWLLRYILHEPQRDSFFAEYGSFVHKIIEKYLRGELAKDDLALYFMRHFAEAVPTAAMSADLKARYYTRGVEYFRHFSFPHDDIVAVEERVEFDLDGAPFAGYIDVISRDGDDLIITDHKSHDLKPFSKRYPEQKTKTDLELESYLRQLILYAVGVKKAYGRYPKTLEFNCFKSGTVISIPFNEEWVKPTLKWASDLRRDIIQESEWTPNVDYFFCKNLCDYRDSCEYCNQ